MNHRTAAALALLAGCTVLPPRDDVSDLPLHDALDATIDRLQEVYPFTEHKDLDWQGARAALHAQADAAEGDEHAIDDVFRNLPLWIPDGHVALFHDDLDRELCRQARGTLGLTLSDLDDGSTIVAAVTPDGPALRAGVHAGDTVIRHNAHPIAAAPAPLHCMPFGMATPERRRSLALRLLARGPLDSMTPLSLLRDGQPLELAVPVEADNLLMRPALGLVPPDTLVEHRMLPNNVGYVRIGWEEPLMTEIRLQRALVALQHDGATSLVVDLRHNEGGMERTAANIVGYFTDDSAFYETVTFYDHRKQAQTPVSEVWMHPQEVRWNHPTVVLIDGETVSSGEGTAMLFGRLPHITVMGFEGTQASFGSAGARIALPGGWALDYPQGQSLDAHGHIQLDSDETGVGGVYPHVRVPWTREHRMAFASGTDVVLDHAIAHLVEGK